MYNDKLKNEYPGLYTISMLFQVIGTIFIIFAIIAIPIGIYLISDYEETSGIIFIISGVISGLVLAVIFFAFTELIKILVRIEFNTRKNIDEEKSEKFDNSVQKQHFLGSEESFEEWKKNNPNKTLNDYFASMIKK